MIFLGDKKELTIFVRQPKSRRYRLVCFGRKAHYRADGSCKHTAAILADLKDRKPTVRVDVEGWGGKRPEPATEAANR